MKNDVKQTLESVAYPRNTFVKSEESLPVLTLAQLVQAARSAAADADDYK